MATAEAVSAARGRSQRWRWDAAAAIFDEYLVVAENDCAMGTARLAHPAAEGGQVTVGVNDISLDGLPRLAVESAVVEGYPHPGKIGGTTEVGPRQGILHSYGFPIAISVESPRAMLTEPG